MNKQELWDAFLDRYPQAKDEEYVIKLKSRGLRRLLEQAWDEGYVKYKVKPSYSTTSNPFKDLFDK